MTKEHVEELLKQVSDENLKAWGVTPFGPVQPLYSGPHLTWKELKDLLTFYLEFASFE